MLGVSSGQAAGSGGFYTPLTCTPHPLPWQLSLSPDYWHPASRSPSVPLACLAAPRCGVGRRGVWPCAQRWGPGWGVDSSAGHPQGTHCSPGELRAASRGAAGGPSEELGSGYGWAVAASKSPGPLPLKIPFSDALLPSTAACSQGKSLAEVAPSPGTGTSCPPQSPPPPRTLCPLPRAGAPDPWDIRRWLVLRAPLVPPAGLPNASPTSCRLVLCSDALL